MRPSDHLGTGHLATRDRRTRNALFAIVAGLLVLPFSSSATAEPGPLSYANAEVSPGRVVVDDTDPGAEGATIGLETFERSIERAGPAASAGVVSSEVGQFVACFDDNVPPAIREVAERAIGRWDDALLLTGPSIELDISWTELGSPTTLAASGPSLFVVDDALPQAGIRYPVGLANELTGFDFSPRSRCDTTAPGDVVVYINSRFGGDDSGWHLGTEPPAEDAIDLETVLLHEVGHGLGFLGSAASGGRGTLLWPYDGGAPYVFESLLRRCSSGSECTPATSPQVAVANDAVLTESDLWFSALNAPMLKLFAPPAWSTGSSLSHLDEGWYPKGTQFSLMTPYVGRGESHRGIDYAALTAIQAMGWPLSGLPQAPQPDPLEVGNANVLLDVATPTLTEAIAPSAYIVEVWRNGAFEQAVQVPSLPARFSNLVNGDSYSFVLQGVSAAGAGPPSPPTEVVTPLELPPFSTAENLVDQVFSGFHGRSPTAIELQAWSMRARSSGEILDVVEELANEPAVELRRRITRLYLGFYGRSPDVGGLRFWSGRAAAGESLERIALQFATASEFEQGREVDDRTFVTAAYERVLGRLPDQNGLIYWERELGSDLDRGRLLVLFSESPEHVAKTGARSEMTIAFDALLSRLPTAAELSTWEPVVRADGVRPLLQAILDDSEFQAA